MVVTQVPIQRGAPPVERRDWWESAACLEADPELFFPVAANGPAMDEIARAKEVCAECRVRRQCLQFALATHQSHGVWGGTTEEERRVQLHRQQTRDDHESLAEPEEAGTEGSVLRDSG